MGGRRLFRYFLLVGLAYAVSTLGAGLADYFTRGDLSTTTNLAISGGVGLLTALTMGAIDLSKQGPPAPTHPPPPHYAASPHYPAPAHYPAPPTTPRRSRGGAGLVIGGLVLLVVCAGGGLALTSGVQWAVRQATALATPPWERVTEDPGVERLDAAVSGQAGPLTLTVLSVRVNAEVTMVKATATNAGTDAMHLPTYKNAQLSIPGATLEAMPESGDWPDTVPAGGEATGTLVFDGVLPAGPVELTLSFATVYGGSLRGPSSISVRIPVTA